MALGYDHALKFNVQHLDASADMHRRNQALERLNAARDVTKGTTEMLCNVQLFSEGVDVPALNSVIFLEPCQSQWISCRPWDVPCAELKARTSATLWYQCRSH